MAETTVALTTFPTNRADAYEDTWSKLVRRRTPDGVHLVSGAGDGLPYCDTGYVIHVPAHNGVIWGFDYEIAAQDLAPAAAHSTYARIDLVCVRLLKESPYTAYLVLKEGTAAISPTVPDLVSDATMHEFALAQVAIPAGTTTLSAASVTDRRSVCTGVDQCAGSLVKLEEFELTASGAALVVGNIPPAFRDLDVRLSMRSTDPSLETLVGMHFNGTAGGTNYDSQELAAGGTSITTSRHANGSAVRLGSVSGAGAGDQYNWSVRKVYVWDYTSTVKRKMVHSFGGYDNSDAPVIEHHFNSFDFQSAINKVDCTLAAGSFAAGSSMVVYGVR